MNRERQTTSVTIDGQEIEVISSDKNIVDVAHRSRIRLPAACYRAKRKYGCCHGCVVEIDGAQQYACSIEPEDGMVVVIDRPDLDAIRNERLNEYREGKESGNPCECDCSGSGGCCG